MTLDRRHFLGSVAAGFGLARAQGFAFQDAKAKAPLRILMLGGTVFLGPEVVEAAMRRGHTVTLFNRGKTNPGLFPDIEKLRGDRNGDLKSLEGRSFDAVVDTSAYYPRWVDLAADVLGDRIGHYVFISSISVYPTAHEADCDESTPVGTLEDPKTEKVTGATYGPLKALCEQAAERRYPGKTTNVRPGLIVGARDPSDRFTYWPTRVKRGGEVLAPGSPGHTVQFIDARDLGEWIVHCIEAKVFGVYNAVGPKAALPMGELLQACKEVSGSDATFTWVDTEFLAEHKVSPWMDMPCWIPPKKGQERCAVTSSAKAIAAGLSFRPVKDTIAHTLEWAAKLPVDRKTRAGISPEREAEVLAAWKARAK